MLQLKSRDENFFCNEEDSAGGLKFDDESFFYNETGGSPGGFTFKFDDENFFYDEKDSAAASAVAGFSGDAASAVASFGGFGGFGDAPAAAFGGFGGGAATDFAGFDDDGDDAASAAAVSGSTNAAQFLLNESTIAEQLLLTESTNAEQFLRTQSTSREQFPRTEPTEQEDMFEKLKSLPLLNLKLRKTLSFRCLAASKLSAQAITQTYQDSGAESESSQVAEKMKAINFPALSLQVGSWQRVSRYEGDLVAKCYYAKKKLVWEFLERSLKRKFEIQWSDILGLRATVKENQPGILELELRQPPAFHHEIDPQPRKHTNWRVTIDFTNGQAPLYRIHTLVFRPGVLDKHLPKILQYDSRLSQLSQQRFPTCDSPFFQSSTCGLPGISLNFSGQRPKIYRSLHFSSPHINPPSLFPDQHFFSAQQVQRYPQTIQQSSSFSFQDLFSQDSVDDAVNLYAENPRMATIWDQENDDFRNASARSQVQGQFNIASTTPPLVEYQSSNYVEANRQDHDHQMITNRLDMPLMLDSQFGCSGEKYSLPNIQPFDGPMITQSIDGNHTIYGQMAPTFSDVDFTANEHPNDAAGQQIHPQPVSWMPAQATADVVQPISWLLSPNTQEITRSQLSNNPVYQMGNDFATFSHNNGVDGWP